MYHITFQKNNLNQLRNLNSKVNKDMRPLFLIVTLICFSINIKAQIQELNAYFTAHQKLNQFNGNVLVAKNNKVVFQNTFNINSVTDNFKITLKSKFIIASVSN